MNLRKKTQPQPADAVSDVENEVMDDAVPIDRPNRRITTAAKNLINFINEINKESREARKKKDRKQDVQIEKPEPIKKQKVEKPVTAAVHPPKPPIQKNPQKHDIPKQQPKPNVGQYYRYNPGDPFALGGIDDTKKLNMAYGNPYDFFLQNQMKQNMSYLPPGMQFLALNPYGFPMQNMQNLQNLQGMQGMHGMSQALQGMHGMFPMNGNKPQYLWHDNRMPMMTPQMPNITQPQNINEIKLPKQQGKDSKIFNRASYHVAIAYNIHIEKLKKKSQAQQMDQSSLDPTHWARRMRDQNQGDRQVVRQIEQISTSDKKQ